MDQIAVLKEEITKKLSETADLIDLDKIRVA